MFKNLGLFMKMKQDGDDLFDRLTVSISFGGKMKFMWKKNLYHVYTHQADNRDNVCASLCQKLQ